MTTSRRDRPILWLVAAIASGVAWFVATPNFDVWPLGWVAMVPGLFAIEHAPTRRRALFYGFVCGLVTNVGGFYWVKGMLERFGQLPFAAAAALLLLLASYQALVFVAFAWAVRALRGATRLPMTLVAPLAMVTFELSVPLVFPFYLAITQAWQLHVIQIADLTGPLGVTALLFMVNGAIYDVLTERSSRWKAVAGAGLVLLLALGYGHLRIGQIAARRAAAPKLDVGVVQPNVNFDMKGVENPTFAEEQLGDLQRRSSELEAAGADLLLWTESSYPYAISRLAAGDFPEGDPRRIRVGFSVPLVMGALTITPRRQPGEYAYNSALLLDDTGRFTARFDKIFLLVFGEYIPGLETFPWLRRYLPAAAGHFARGKETTIYPLTTRDGHEIRIGPMICYEDIIPSFGRKLAAHHPNLLVNMTNDAWFGDTSEPWEHLALSVFRAVELRTELVRAVNTGVSAFVDATGKVFAKTYAVDPGRDPRGADKLLAEVALLEGGHTVYSAVGDVFGYLCAAVTAVLALVIPRRRRRLITTDPSGDE